jgi:hypothetical protein
MPFQQQDNTPYLLGFEASTFELYFGDGLAFPTLFSPTPADPKQYRL